MIYTTALILRIIALLIMLIGVIPNQVRELQMEKNGLRKLKILLLLFTMGVCSLNIAAIALLFDLSVNTKTTLANAVIILNGMGYLIGSVLFYRIYHRKF